MADYTIQLYSAESAVQVGHYQDGTTVQSGSFNFSFQQLKDFIIKSITIATPITAHDAWNRGITSGALKLGSTTVATFPPTNLRTTWSASSLSLSGSATASLEIKHEPYKDDTYINYVHYGRATATIVYSAESSSSNVFPLSGQSIAKSLQNTFTWQNVSPGSPIASQILYWKYSTDSTYNTINLSADATSYTFPANFFNNGTINWRIGFTDSASNTSYSPVETVDVGIVPSVEIAYPIGVNIKSSNIQIFTWEMHEDVPTGQYSYEIQYKESEDADWTVVTGTSSNQYHSFAADTFSAGEYQWKLKVTNNDGLSSEYVNSTFTAIGATDAPVITSVTNSSIPTITWTVTSQDTFEVEIYKGQERIYTSGVQVGYDVRSFTPNIMLDDGNYIIKMRAMNQYGFFTPWLDYSFVLDPEHPDALTCYAYANDHHGVTIARSLELDPVIPDAPGEPSDVPDAHYVIRRGHGETNWKIIGKLNPLDESVKFEDNTVLPNVAYDYAIRNYESGAGFTDSNVVTITISFQEYILSSMTDGNKFVLFYRTEDQQFDMSHGSSKNQSYSYMIGRKYPVRESSEWLAHNDSFSCFVSFEEYERLLEFYSGNDDLWFRGKNFTYQCSIDELSIKDALLGDGYTLGISVSRTDEEELRLF